MTQFVDFKQFKSNNSLYTGVILKKKKSAPILLCIIGKHFSGDSIAIYAIVIYFS